MKAIKLVGKVVLWIVGIVVVLLLALPLWIGPVVKTAANAVVPKKTGTSFNLGAFGLNPYSGKLAVGDVQLFNPEGFSQKMAVTLGSFNVEVDVASVAGDPIVVKDIVLKDVFVSYDVNGKGESNFSIIQKNAKGADGEATAEPKKPEAKPAADEKSAKKVVIDHLLVQNVLVQLGPIPMPMPNIELSGIGRKSNGVTMQEAWDQIYAQITQNLNALGVNINDLAGNLGKAGIEHAQKILDSAKQMKVEGVHDAIKGGASILGDAAGKTTDTVGEGAKKTADAVTGSATKAVDAVSGGATKAVDAVNEQTDKAVNALKGLFK